MVREEEYAKTVAKNLKRLLYEHEKTQADLSRDLKKMGLDIPLKSLILCGFADFEGRIGGRLVAKIKKAPPK